MTAESMILQCQRGHPLVLSQCPAF
ncbi:hypothetical protein CGRA01v4_01258 [Colletotrichum graminicola]|nr:hypothetical protein CGRA01v4_01258 [Colletotrichum graminicola]